MSDITALEPIDLDNLVWEKEVEGKHCQVSTSRHLLDLTFINDAMASEDMPWARALSDNELVKMVGNSLFLAVYELSETKSKQLGMARLITDHVTFAYLTDVYIAPGSRRYGHARWLMQCCSEVFEKMSALRRGFLVTGLSYGATFYKETLNFHNVNEEEHLIALTGKPQLRKQDPADISHNVRDDQPTCD